HFKQYLEVKESLILMLRQEKEILNENLKSQDIIIQRLQTSIAQQDESAAKYQQEILTLQKESDTLKEVLLKTERRLQEAADENKELEAKMQDKTRGQNPKRLEIGSSFDVNSILKRLGRPLTNMRISESDDVIQTEEILQEVPNLLIESNRKSNEQINSKASPQGRNELEHHLTLSDSAQWVSSRLPMPSEQLSPTRQHETVRQGEGLVMDYDKQQPDKLHLAQLIFSEFDGQHRERPDLVSEEQPPSQVANFWAPSKLVRSESGRAEPWGVEQVEEQDKSTCNLQSILPECSKLPEMDPLSRLDKPELEQENCEADEQQQQEHLTLEAQLKHLVPQEPIKELIEKDQPFEHVMDVDQEDETHPASQPLVASMLEQGRTVLASNGKSNNINHDSVLEKHHDEGVRVSDSAVQIEQPKDTQSLQKLEGNSGSEFWNKTLLHIHYSEPSSNINVRKEGLPSHGAYETRPEMDIPNQHSVSGKKGSISDGRLRCSSVPKAEPKPCKKKAFVPASANQCLCNMPPYGYMVNCKVCDTHFHAACLEIEQTLPGGESYTCKSCKDQPNRKRRQVQSSKCGTENTIERC
ncbi:hypothetical protein GOP47_0019604, partial [Adiantum capillus-veneris]